jgi:hypothetical protein
MPWNGGLRTRHGRLICTVSYKLLLLVTHRDGGIILKGISKNGKASPIRLKIREFLRPTPTLGRTVSSTVVTLDKWAASVQANPAQLDGARKSEGLQGSITIERIANRLVGKGKEADLLSKSLQETLFYCVGFDADISPAGFADKFARYLKRRGPPPFIQRFLSLFFFNYVWSETRDSFMALAETPSDFEKDMENVERVCQRAVASIWKSFEDTRRPLSSVAAKELVRTIEKSLRN